MEAPELSVKKKHNRSILSHKTGSFLEAEKGVDEEVIPGSLSQQRVDPQNIMAVNSKNRANVWASRTLADFKMVSALKEGLYGKNGHITKHVFREEDKQKHLTDQPMLNRK